MSYTATPYDPYDFANRRHIGPSPAEMEQMLRAVGAPILDALIDGIVPYDIRLKLADASAAASLMDRDAYEKLIA